MFSTRFQPLFLTVFSQTRGYSLRDEFKASGTNSRPIDRRVPGTLERNVAARQSPALLAHSRRACVLSWYCTKVYSGLVSKRVGLIPSDVCITTSNFSIASSSPTSFNLKRKSPDNHGFRPSPTSRINLSPSSVSDLNHRYPGKNIRYTGKSRDIEVYNGILNFEDGWIEIRQVS